MRSAVITSLVAFVAILSFDAPARAQQPRLEDVLPRVTDHIGAYVARLIYIVAEEHFNEHGHAVAPAAREVNGVSQRRR